MASTTLQLCAPVLVGRGGEGAAIAPKWNSHGAAASASFHRTGSDGFEKAFLTCAVKRSLSKSSSLDGSVDLPWHRCTGDVLRSFGPGRGNSPRAQPVMQAPVAQTRQMVEKLPTNVEMLEAYEVNEKVRDYELDHYGVVKNAIYAQFCQQARTELLENIGFSPDAVTETGRAMAISDMTMKFVSPLRSGDRYIVSSRVAGTTAVRLIFEDHIYRLPARELVMSCKSTVVVLDQNSKPGRLPEEIKIGLVKGYLTNHKVNDISANGYYINGNLANYQVNGKSTSGHSNGDSGSGHVNGSSRTGQVNGNSTNGYVIGDLVNDYVNGKSTSKVPSLVS